MELKGVLVNKVQGPMADGSVGISFKVDPSDAESAAALMLLGANAVQLDLKISESESPGRQAAEDQER
jgi:hypothetical protein